jgi:hypothetical protein
MPIFLSRLLSLGLFSFSAASQQTTYSMVHKEPVPKALLKPYVYQRLVLDDDGPAPPTYEDVLADARYRLLQWVACGTPCGLGRPGYRLLLFASAERAGFVQF